MNMFNSRLIRPARCIVALALLATASACLEHKIDNQQSIGRIAVRGPDGATLEPASPIPAPPAMPVYVVPFPIKLTLDATESHDPDGEIVSFEWRRTDVPSSARFADFIPPAAGAGGSAAPATAGAAAPRPPYATATYAALDGLEPGVPTTGLEVSLPLTPGPGATRSVGTPPAPTPVYMYSLWTQDNAGEFGPVVSIAIAQAAAE